MMVRFTDINYDCYACHDKLLDCSSFLDLGSCTFSAGKLDKKELGVVMEKRKRKLLKHQTEFLNLQATFDKGEL